MPPKRTCHAALLAAATAYLLFLLLFEMPSISTPNPSSSSSSRHAATHRARGHELEASALPSSSSPLRPDKATFPHRTPLTVSSVCFHRLNSSSSIDASALAAFTAARPHLTCLLSASAPASSSSPSPSPSSTTSCPVTVSVPKDLLVSGTAVAVELQCGMVVGSRVTVVARPRVAARSEGGAPRRWRGRSHPGFCTSTPGSTGTSTAAPSSSSTLATKEFAREAEVGERARSSRRSHDRRGREAGSVTEREAMDRSMAAIARSSWRSHSGRGREVGSALEREAARRSMAATTASRVRSAARSAGG